MKELLTEFLRIILIEGRVKAVTVPKTGDPDQQERIVYFGSQKTAMDAYDAGTHRPYVAGTDNNLPGARQKPIGSDIPKGLIGRKEKEPSVLDKPQTGTEQPTKAKVTAAPEGVENLNATSLASQIKNGIVSPGNDFSRYSESVSVFIAKSIVDNPDMSDEEIMKQMTRLDCGSKTLSAKVGATIPRRYQNQYKELQQSGAFTAECDTGYSEEQNRARFMTMIVAKKKANRMRKAIERTGKTGFNVDSFSGDKESRRRMEDLVSSASGKIFTETGEELSKEEAMKMIKGFGTSKFPADTALIARNSEGDLILTGFSDKKDLSAIINNSTVNKDMQETLGLLDSLLASKKMTEEVHQRLTAELKTLQQDYDDEEDKLKTITTSPATKLIEIAKNSPDQLKDLIEKAKNLSGGKDPAKFWNSRIEKFKTAATKKPSSAAYQEYVPWLQAAGWDGESEITDALAITAFAMRCESILSSEDEDLPKDDQEILFRLGVVPKEEIVRQSAEVRSNTLKLLAKMRETLDQADTNVGVPLGTLIDGVRAWKALHLDMKEYKGSLTMVAEDVVVYYESIVSCLDGIESTADFIRNLSIDSKDIVSKEYGVTTGQRIEVFTVSPSGNRVDVGVRSVRSKGGILGKLQTTYTYHPKFQDCLASKDK